jgi:hypothetical protein
VKLAAKNNPSRQTANQTQQAVINSKQNLLPAAWFDIEAPGKSPAWQKTAQGRVTGQCCRANSVPAAVPPSKITDFSPISSKHYWNQLASNSGYFFSSVGKNISCQRVTGLSMNHSSNINSGSSRVLMGMTAGMLTQSHQPA